MNNAVICTDCQVAMKLSRSGAYVAEMFGDPPKPYKIWSADVLTCPGCLKQVVTCFGANPLAEHWQDDFLGKLYRFPVEFYWHERTDKIPPAPVFTDDDIRRDDLPRDVFELIHDLAYDHEGRDRAGYKLQAHKILRSRGVESVEKMRHALQFIASQEDLLWAECSLAEQITTAAREALGWISSSVMEIGTKDDPGPLEQHIHHK